jgi:hypothetical protein
MSALKLNILFILVKYLCFVNGAFFYPLFLTFYNLECLNDVISINNLKHIQ